MAHILILYSTTDGQTLRICERLREQLAQQGNTVELQTIDAEPLPDLAAFDKLLIGASIRYGKHARSVYRFVQHHLAQLQARPAAFFSVNAVARKPNRNTPETNPYLKRFIAQIAWQPQLLAVFGGRIDYSKYRIWDRLLIQLIMWMTKGPTAPDAVVEFTDWDAVRRFGEQFDALSE